MLSNQLLRISITESFETIKFLVYVMAFFVFFLQAIIIINRLISRRNKKLAAEIRKHFELLLTGIIFIDDSEQDSDGWAESKKKMIRHFKKNYLKSDFNRRVLVEDLLLLNRAYKGGNAVRLKELYYALELDVTGIQVMKRANATLKAKIIRDLTQMEVKSAIPAIRKLTQHPSPLVRLEANISLFYLDVDNAFGMLNTSDELSTWEMMKLFANIKRIDPANIPSFKKWLNSKNRSVVFFALHLIAHFNQQDSLEEVKNLLNHVALSIKLKAMEVLVEINYNDFLKDEIKDFENKFNIEKKTIIRLIGKAKANENYDFLLNIVQYKSPELALEAGRSIVELGTDYFEKFELSIQNELLNTQALKVYKHISDKRLILT